MRLSSQELDGCDFVSEHGSEPPRGGCEGRSQVVNNIQVTVNLEVCGCKGSEGKAREQSERVANILTKVVKGGGGLVVCKQVDYSKIKNMTSEKLQLEITSPKVKPKVDSVQSKGECHFT